MELEPLGDNERCFDPLENGVEDDKIPLLEPSDQIWSSQEHELASVVDQEHQEPEARNRPTLDTEEVKQ